MDNEQPHQELVKCVVVGDTAVGKTRLICARACNKHVSLSQLLTTHVPTVWAIDQYRIYKDVLERSWEVVDGVNVSLRLWDTFGDHEKDRRFAYGRSDVVLLCFSVTNPVSLRNCGAMWYPEIRKFCPHTPILLVGCKNDLRYMYRDEQYLSYFRDRSPFVRATRKSDLVMPDQGRVLARELGIYYYETSVFSYFGVNEVFENAIRAALMARRQQRFWMTNLKRVQRPLLQAPFRPPKPLSPDVVMTASCYIENMKTMLTNQFYTDAVIISGSKGYPTHKFMLAASSNAFYRLFTMNLVTFNTPSGELARSSSESSMVSSLGEATAGEFNEDTEYLIGPDQLKLNSRVWEQIKRRSSCQILSSSDITKKPKELHRDLNHPAFLSIRVVKCENIQPGQSATQTVITLSKLITQEALQQCLNFMYTGIIDNGVFENQEVRHAAEFLELHQMTQMLVKIQSTQTLMNVEEMQQYHAPMRKRLREIAADRGLFSDITFELDDGAHQAHKTILIARCDVMRAMFQGHFRESTARVIRFPGIKAYAFHKLLCFLYVDTIPHISASRCLNLLELANRLCLTRLVSIVEMRVIEDLNRMLQVDSNEVIEQCLRLVEPVKLHNAHQLADWCMWRLCINYDRVCRSWPRAVRLLHNDNRDYLSENRWPPVWYLKEYDYYQKCCAEQRKEVKPPMKRKQRENKQLQPQGSSDNEERKIGCICFTSKSRRGTESAPDASTSLFQSSNSVSHGAPVGPL